MCKSRRSSVGDACTPRGCIPLQRLSQLRRTSSCDCVPMNSHASALSRK
jgi:hypothetical protein